MDHKENRLEVATRLAALVALAVPLPKQLRSYQVETIAAMIRWLEDLKGSRRAYVSHATGLGKTTLFASMVTACAGLRILVVVPSKILIEQTARELYTFTRGMIGHVSSLKNIEDENGEIICMKGHDMFDVVLVTDASMAKHGWRLAQEFSPHLVIRDECHWTYAEKRQKVMDFFPESVTIGFSATPDYITNQARPNFVPVTLDNGQVLYAPQDRLAQYHYGTKIDERTVRWGIEEGFLAPLAWGHVEFDFSLDGVRDEMGDDAPDFNEQDLQALLSEKWEFMQETVVELYKSGQYGLRDRQVFAVCHNVWAAEKLAESLRQIGVSAACITGKTRDTERNAVLSAFKTGGIKFLSSVMVLREGWNAPNAEVCLMLRPTKSRVFYVQSMGRVLRQPEDGSAKVALVIDAFFQNTTFAPLSAPVLFGHPGQEIGDGDYLIKLGDADRVKESPYKTGLVKPRLVTVEGLKIEYWANADGDLYFEGMRWRHLVGICEYLDVGTGSFYARLAKQPCRTMEARSFDGKRITFYLVEDAEKIFADLLDLPECDEEGFIVAEGVRWGTIGALASAIGVSTAVVAERLEKAGVSTMYGRNRNRRRFLFYRYEDALRVCGGSRHDLPQAGEDGFFEADGTRWGMEHEIAVELGISVAFRRRLSSDCRKRDGRSRTGHVATFFAVEDVRREYAEQLSDLPTAGSDNVLNFENVEWLTLSAFADRHNTTSNAVAARVESSVVRSCRAKDQGGRVFTYYATPDLEVACAELLKKLPQANDTGFIDHDGVLWGTVSGLKDLFKTAFGTIEKRVKGPGIRSLEGRTTLGRTRTFYAVPDVEQAIKAAPKRVVAKKGEGKRSRNPCPSNH